MLSEVQAQTVEYPGALAEELARYRAQLVHADKMSAAGDLLAGIVHELNNPLTTILGFSELLLSEQGSGDARIQKIHAEAQRSVRIVQNLLNLARNGGNELEVVDVNESILRTVELTEFQLRLHKIDIDLSLSRKSPRVLARSGELTQVALNLITNAIQSISASRSSGRISISTAVMQNNVRICVSDNGPGICEANIRRIFEPFFTTKQNGHGVGLSLSRKLIRESGGDMWVSSAESCGATFTIQLPVLAFEPVAERDPGSDDSRAMIGSRSVLIVDDEEYVAELVASILQQSGYRTSQVNEGAPAIELLKKNDYDILVCDLHMPGIDGRDLMQWVRSNKQNMHVLLLSGDVARQDTAQFAKSCGAHFLSKPFTMKELTKAVRRLFS